MLKYVIVAVVCAVLFCCLLILSAASVKAAETVVRIRDVQSGDLVVTGFELIEKGRIKINSVGATTSYSKQYVAYGWILDAQSRELVWSMQDDCRDGDEISDNLIECIDHVRLEPGKYEVYYYVGNHNILTSGNLNISIDDLGDLFDILGDVIVFDHENHRLLDEEDYEELMLTIRTDAPVRDYFPRFGDDRNAIVNFNQPQSDEYHSQGFTLKKEIDLKVYAIGEYSDSHELFVDGAWIINADTRERVWRMDEWNTDRAGGARKNRCFQGEITLPSGNYIAYYVTDDTHDPGEWNQPPPADPNNYGLVISATDPSDLNYVTPFEEKLIEFEILKIVRVRNSELRQKGFILKEQAKIHIEALGELCNSDRCLADMGWIVNADNMERVWAMDVDNVEYAGGAAKNCRFDGIIELPPGNYMVYYRTDDSHAYRSWNSSPPFDRRKWGISLAGMGEDFDNSKFSLTDEFEPSGDVLVNLTGIGDDMELSRRFSLKQATPIRIIALGEGKGRTMYDYGWIENDETGEVIWEMTYRKTRHAGGANKNRISVANIILDEGKYTVYFVTDGSHSFEDFNASPPDNPESWGVVITQR